MSVLTRTPVVAQAKVWSTSAVSGRRLPRNPLDQLTDRPPVLGVLAATAIAGMLFGPVFGSTFPAAVAIPVLAVVGTTYLCYEAAHRWARLERWRAAASVLLGLLAVVVATLHTAPTPDSVRALYDGVRRSWLLTLQSTLPARPDPRLTMFVPLLVLAAAVLGVHVLCRTRARLVALLPSLAVAGLAQAYHPLSDRAAVLAVLAYVAAAALVLSSVRRSTVRFAGIAAAVAVPTVVALSFAGITADPAHRSAYALKNAAAPVPMPTAVTSPLDEIAYRLEHPNVALFTVRGPSDVDRWPLATLDRFDGTNWTSTARYRYLGSRLGGDQTLGASITDTGLPGPWLPSQRGLDTVAGLQPLVDETTGTLLYDGVKPGTEYRIGWSAPDVGNLSHAALAPMGKRDMGAIPAGIITLAKTAVDRAAPSFQTALVLERYLREHYKLAVGRNLPAGHGWPQILQFLGANGTGSRTGTTEQFAAAYVVLARVIGIPARLVVGFRQPARPQSDGSYLVHNADVLAWPEVAVAGVGWIPLDPSGATHDSGSADSTPLARATDRARSTLPPPQDQKPKPQPNPPTPPAAAAPDHTGGSSAAPFVIVAGAVLVGGLIGWLVGVPLAKELRNGSRRRRTGNAAVLSAWLETRDRLRDHGIAVDRGMTVRDVAHASGGVLSRSAEHAIEQLGLLVDAALWSGTTVTGRGIDIAWQACDIVRHSLADRPIADRITATLGIRGLRSLH